MDVTCSVLFTDWLFVFSPGGACGSADCSVWRSRAGVCAEPWGDAFSCSVQLRDGAQLPGMKHKPVHAHGGVWAPLCLAMNVTAAELLSPCSAPGLGQAGFLLVPLPELVISEHLQFHLPKPAPAAQFCWDLGLLASLQLGLYSFDFLKWSYTWFWWVLVQVPTTLSSSRWSLTGH